MKTEINADVVEAVANRIRVELNQWNLDMRDGKDTSYTRIEHELAQAAITALVDMGWKMEGAIECAQCHRVFNVGIKDIVCKDCAILPPQTGQLKRDGVEGGE